MEASQTTSRDLQRNVDTAHILNIRKNVLDEQAM